MPHTDTGIHLVGRDVELSRLRQDLAGALTGSPRMLVVAGESGVGKSALWHEVTAETDALVLTGYCLPLQGESIPFAPVIGTLRSLCRALDLDQLSGLLTHWPAEFDSLLPAGILDRPDAQPARSSDTDRASSSRSAQSRLFETLLSLLDQLTHERPVLWLVEDVHWADRSTLDLLVFLARNLTTERAMVGLSVRTDDLHRAHPLRAWLHEMARLPRVSRVDLPRLTRAATGQQLRALARSAGTSVDEALVDAVFERSDGNPMFTEELLPWTAGQQGALPETLHDLVIARLARLEEPVHRLLQMAAVLGPRFDIELLAQVADVPERAVEEAVQAAVDRHLLVASTDSTYSFAHPIFGEVLEGDLVAGVRRRLHEAAARALTPRTDARDGRFETVGMIAHHWDVAQQPGPALSAAVSAGLAAQQMRAFAEADDYFGRALELAARDDVGHVARRLSDADLLLHASEVAHVVGDDGRAIDLADRAVAVLPDPERRSVALERKGTYCFHAGRPDEGEAAFRSALELLPPEPTRARARVLSGIGLLATGWTRLDVAVEICAQAIDVARAAGAQEEEGRALNALGVATALGGDLPTGIAFSREAVAIAEGLDDPDDLSLAYINLTHLLSLAGECDEALLVCDRGYRALSRVGLVRQEGSFLQANVAEGLERAGRWREAAALVERALAQHPRGLRGFPVLQHAARLKLHQGDLEAAEDLVGQAKEALAEHAPPDSWRRELLELEAELLLWAGRPAQALSVAEDGLALVEGGDEGRFGGSLATLLARALADLSVDAGADGDLDVPALTAELRARAEAMTPSPFEGAMHPMPDGRATELTLRAELARAEGGRQVLDAWSAAAAAWEAIERPFPAAYARWRDAEAQVLTKQVGERPVQAVRRAHTAATELGAERLVAEVEMLALWGRVDLVADEPVDAEPSYPGLTAREVEILQCLMAGQTNREIAESLFISVKTVSVHVSNILRKQGVSSREEAARLGHRRSGHRPGAASPGTGRR